MALNQFKRGELYFVITGVANTALARRLQKYFNEAGLNLSVEQWSMLVHLWKEDGLSQQALGERTFRDKPSVTRLIHNMEKQGLVTRVGSQSDRRRNHICLTESAKSLRDKTMGMANLTLNEGLAGVDPADVEITKRVLARVYENLK
ncbi:MAG: MarR family transcriptional regulator [Bacteroidetes bacterium]|nr:MAG: MarR family transcriptional regulator [Bacteroidota bacterium]